MTLRVSNLLKIAGVVGVTLVLVVVSAAAVRKLKSPRNETDADNKGAACVDLAGPDTVRFIRPDVVKTLGIQVAKAEKAMKRDRQEEKHGRQLVLRGTLGPDTDRYVQI